MWHWGWGFGVFPFFLVGAGLRVIVIAAIVVGVVYLVRGIGRRSGTGHGESALDILERRYARGEITREQFEEMKRNLR